MKYSIQILIIFFVLSFLHFSCTVKDKRQIDLSSIVGDYSYKKTKTMGGVNITGEWKLTIVRNAESDYSYTYTYIVTDQMYGNIPKVNQVLSGKFGELSPSFEGFKWYFTGELNNSYIEIPKDGFTTPPQILNFTSGSEDYKYFGRINTSSLNSNSTKKLEEIIDTPRINFRDINFMPLKFLIENKSTVNDILSKYNGDYYEIAILDNNKFLNEIRLNDNLDKSCQLTNSGINLDDIINALSEGAPLYEVFVIRSESKVYKVGNVNSYVNGNAILYELLIYNKNRFVEISFANMKYCEPVLNAYNVWTVFKRGGVREKDTSQNIIEIPNKNNMTLWNEISISESKWFSRIYHNVIKENEEKSEGEYEQETSYDNNTKVENEFALGLYETKADKVRFVYFHNEPNVLTRRKAYFNSKETVNILKVENSFGYVEFTNSKGQKSKGWLDMRDVILKQ
jgi:hypothetical protein